MSDPKPEGGDKPTPPPVGPAQKPKAPRPTKYLPTDRIAFTKQLDLLRTYAIASGPVRKPVTLAEVEDIIKMKGSTISLANPFFVDSGLLQKTDKGFVPSEAVQSFQRAHQWQLQGATAKLAPVIAQTWFGKKLLVKLAFRPIDEKEAIGDLADESTASPEYEPQIRTLIDYVVVAGLAIRDGTLLRPGGQADGVQNEPDPAEPTSIPSEPDMPASTSAKTTIMTSFAAPTNGGVQFNVNVNVDMNEFAGWQAERIAAFFNGIAQVLAAKGQIERSASDK